MSTDPFADELSATASVTELQVKVDRITGLLCARCGQKLCGHQALFAIALGTQDRPLCHECLAKSLDRTAEQLRFELQRHFQHRDCYGQVWNNVTALEPECQLAAECEVSLREPPSTHVSPTEPAAVVEWDAGDLACGDLLLQLRVRLRDLAPGTHFRLTSRDRGAIEDIPAWCRLTGHRLLSESHPMYCIERKHP